MRTIKYSITVIMIGIIIFMLFCSPTSAMNVGLSTVEINNEQQNIVIDNINLNLLNNDICQNSTGCICFDVNSDGMLAIGCEIGSISYVCVHDAKRKFLYSYSFETNGSFSFEWTENNLAIYFIRSGLAAYVDNKGTIINVKLLEDTVDNSIYMNSSVKASKKEMDGITYIMRNNFLVSPTFSQIVAIDKFGNETVLFDKTTDHAISFTLCIVTLVIFVSSTVFVLVLQIRKRKGNLRIRTNHSVV